MKKPAVFLDRDGTMTAELGYLTDLESIVYYPRVERAIRLLNHLDFLVVVATNQSAIARGMVSEAAVRMIHDTISNHFGLCAARIDAFYFCPHHPEATQALYRAQCDCRKPAPGLLLQAARDLGIDLERSYMVGDQTSDLQAGAKAGCTAVLVLTGKGGETLVEMDARLRATVHVAPDLLAASRWIALRAWRSRV